MEYRLLCVEHIDKKGKPLLYLVFEYVDMDLKKYMDWHTLEFNNPLPSKTIQVGASSSYRIIRRCEKIIARFD